MLKNLVQTLVWLILLHTAQSAFVGTDVNGTYVLRLGFPLCPQRIQFDNPPFPSIPPTSFLVDDERCTTGAFRAIQTPTSADRPDPLAIYLRGERNAGAFVSLDVTEDIICPNRTFSRRAWFNLVRADENFTLSWLDVFGLNTTALATANGDAYTFVRNVSHVIVNDLCLFTRFNARDRPPAPGRACFPADARTRTRDGRLRRMDELRTGDYVAAGDGAFSQVVGWTHRAARARGAYVRVRTGGDGGLVVTRGHLVPAEGRLVPAGELRAGMVVTGGAGERRVVTEVVAASGWGLYNPQTVSGDIVVDGVLCSTYTSAVGPGAAHALLAPVRFMWGFGVDLLRVLRVFEGVEG